MRSIEVTEGIIGIEAMELLILELKIDRVADSKYLQEKFRLRVKRSFQ
jgi:hypothetical protein